jgi:pimeloyl-ACP methyl ester carboxylesterase
MPDICTSNADAPKLDPCETHFRIPGPHPGLSLFLRHLPPASATARGVVLYVHGGTFPSALSIAHRFDGFSWRDSLCAAGFHCWGLDFHGFGHLSDPYPDMAQPADAVPPLGGAADASAQLECAVRFICAQHRVPRLSLVAHSWGGIVAAHFAAWGEAYLDVDPRSRTRSPPAVQVPSGAFQDIYDAWAGRLAYDPALVRAPVAIIRGEWDSLCTDADAAWMMHGFHGAALRRDVKIGRATHLMHLEEARFALYRETETFLCGEGPSECSR